MSIYTRKGDHGSTSLATGERVPKCDDRVEAYGTLDELSAFIGVLQDSGTWTDDQQALFHEIQVNLLTIEGNIAGYEGATLPEDATSHLEQVIDALDNPPLKRFVIPGGNLTASYCHVCRTVCRRAERQAVKIAASEENLKYVNRLSDYFFELGRFLCR